MKKKILACLSVIIFLYTTNTNAFFVPLPPGPVSPTVDLPQDAIGAGKTVIEKVKTVYSDFQAKKAELLNKLKSSGLFAKLTGDKGALKKKGKGDAVNPAMKEIKTSGIDMTDEEAVMEKFEELFLTYPMDLLNAYAAEYRPLVKQQYLKKQVEFANDNMLEIDVAARYIEDDTLPALQEELNDLSSCYILGQSTSGNCEASPADEELGNYVNSYKLKKTLDSYLRVYEELMALNAQASAAMVLQDGIKPFNEEEADRVSDSEKHSFNYRGHYESTEKMGFAQQSARSKFSLVQAPKRKQTAAFKEDQLKAMTTLDEVYRLLSTAQKMHNLKQQLSDLRGPFIEYEKMRRLHDKAIGNLIQAEKNAVTYLGTYYDSPADIWFGKGCRLQTVHLGKQCPLLTGCKSQDELVTYNTEMIVCPDQMFGVEAYTKKRGWSKEMISVYTLAQLENNTDVMTSAIEGSLESVTPDSNTSLDLASQREDPEGSRAKILGTSEQPADESAKDFAAEATRIQELIRWQAGAERARLIGANTEVKAKMPYPIWSDEKKFYDQYLREKYRNMALYFNKRAIQPVIFNIASQISEAMTIDENAVQAYAAKIPSTDTQKAEKVKAYRKSLENKLKKAKKSMNITIARDLKGFMDDLKQNPDTNVVGELKTKFDAETQRLIESRDNDIADLKAEKEEVYARIEELKAPLNAHKKHYNELKDKIEEAQNNIKTQNDAIQTAIKKKNESAKSEAEAAKKEQEAIIAEAQRELDSMTSNMDGGQADMDALNKSAQEFDKKIEERQKAYLEQAMLVEAKYFADLHEEQQKRNASVSAEVKVLEQAGDAIVDNIYGMAVDMFSAYKEAAQSAVERAYDRIIDLGEEKYNPNAYNNMLRIHQDMLSEINQAGIPTLSKSVSNLVIGNAGFITVAADLISQAAFNGNCENLGCDKEDKVYFVGLTPKGRDFTAPRRIAAERSAPIREILHFDRGDYDQIAKIAQRKGTPKTTRYEFLKGMEKNLPTIWKQILAPNGFVERDVDISEILTGEQPNVPPMLLQAALERNQRLRDAFFKAKGEKPAQVPVGELSLFLTYDDGLRFSDDIVKLVSYFDPDRELDEDEVKEYTNRLMARNQFGDYLKFVDVEKAYQAKMYQLEVQIDESRQQIEEVLKEADCHYSLKPTGYISDVRAQTEVASTEFIADEQTYQTVAKCLKNGKNNFIAQAVKVENTLPTTLTEGVQERKDKVDRMRQVMEMDKEEWVLLSDNTEPDAALNEQIKQKQVDSQVVDTYGEDAQSEFEKQLNEFEVPFLARYF